VPVKPGRAVGNIWLVLAAMGYARGGYLNRLLDVYLAVARDFQPDLIFTDLDPSAFMLACVTGLPVAATHQHVMRQGSGSLPWRLLGRAIAAALKRHGAPALTPDDLYFGAPVLRLIPSIPELDGAPPDDSSVYYAGSLLGEIYPGQDFTPEPGKRYVFTYVGTGSISLDTLRRVLPAVFPASGDMRCLVGAQSVTEPERIEGVEFRSYWPDAALLPHCDWTICHGGQNTIARSLLNGVPLLIFPGAVFERRFNAQKIAEAGAGFMGELPDFNAAWLCAKMAQRAKCLPAAAGLGERIASYGGAAGAVETMAAWVEKSKKEI
jgi:UDP:flavonoid glycosyltransferase YjiC (YdhE family)